jgi:YihY family inner membrane protein
MVMSTRSRRRPPSKSGSGADDGDAERPGGISGRLWDLDRLQQRHRRTSFVAAVLKKFGDDQGGQLAALISYYAFVSLFPLLLVLVTVLGYVLQGDPAERERILNGTLGQFPIISDQLKLQPLHGSPVALVIGIIGSLLAGLGIMGASQTAFNRIWHVPFKDRPNFIFARLRSLGMLAILGTVAIVSTVAAGFVGSASHGAPAVVAGILVAFAANLVLFMIAFKLLTATDLSWRTLLPGVIVAAVLWQLLQHLGGFYLDHILKRTGPLYGVFALVLGLLAWLYLGGQLTVLAAEVNVVKERRLWPRSFFGQPLLPADRRALRESAETEERVKEENVEVDFDGDGGRSR